MACLLTEQLSFTTTAGFSFHDITAPLQNLVDRACLGDGVLVAAGQHTTTALVVNEHEERLLADIEAFFRRLVPQG